jgi:hypothetical protein
MGAVADSTFSGPSATSSGGGIANDGMLTITDSTLSGNSATTTPGSYGSEGGGIYNTGTLTVVDSTLSGNSSGTESGRFGSQGGGIYNTGSLTLTDSTLSGNSSTSSGGGTFNARGSRARLAATIVANSTSGKDCHGVRAFTPSGKRTRAPASTWTTTARATSQQASTVPIHLRVWTQLGSRTTAVRPRPLRSSLEVLPSV